MMKKSDNPFLQYGMVDLPGWLSGIALKRKPAEVELITKACTLVEANGGSIETPFGLTCFYQGLVMADILDNLGLDAGTIAAAIAYETFRYGQLSEAQISKLLGDDVVHLLVGVHKMHSAHADRQIQQTENLRRLLLAVVEDIRAALIKLAEYTAEMRAVIYLDDGLRKRYAIDALEIYGPLANRLGIGQIKWELEDLAFRFMEPAAYKHIAQLLLERRIDREEFIHKTADKLEDALKNQGINAEVRGRAKHIYGIWKKMQRKGVGYHEIYDVHAIRVLAPNIKECYAALGVVHTLWHHVPKEFDDYLANPKNNGYRSLHTAVIGPENKTIEVQIRTKEMHDQAELGVAAHWRYKEGVSQDKQYEMKLTNLRQVLKWQEDWPADSTSNEALRTEVFQDRVYVLTPKGKVIDLPLGATVLDFAYDVHTEVGNRCRGAKVNGRMTPLTHALKSGDQIEVITAKTGGPSRDWLNPQFGYLKTVKARAKAQQWFKRQDREQNIIDGREVLDRELQRLGVDNLSFESIAAPLKVNKVEDMLAGIGGGDIRVTQILSALQTLISPSLLKVKPPKPPVKRESLKFRSEEIIVAGVGNLYCQMARCCKPVPGDEIIGYVIAGRGVSVHRRDCVNILQAKERQLSRLIQVEWMREAQNLYSVDMLVGAYDRPGLLRDISSVLASENINVVDIRTLISTKDNAVDFKLTIEISGIELLSKIFKRLQQLPNVIFVNRVQQ
jgi:GTP pyrophosphokinase